jgi:uncharacterized tellurite resistance protein B-like protein
MLPAIRKFFDQFMAARSDDPGAVGTDRARLAAAALLVEVVRSDANVSDAERSAILAAVQGKFSLDPEAARELVALAEAEAREAHDTYQFTSSINAGFSTDQKRELVEELWRLAYEDATLHRHEEHLIRRVAELLHVPHSAFIRAKLMAEAARRDRTIDVSPADPAIVKPPPRNAR